eukprot:4348479-Prymnesium_polylepis.1
MQVHGPSGRESRQELATFQPWQLMSAVVSWLQSRSILRGAQRGAWVANARRSRRRCHCRSVLMPSQINRSSSPRHQMA